MQFRKETCKEISLFFREPGLSCCKALLQVSWHKRKIPKAVASLPSSLLDFAAVDTLVKRSVLADKGDSRYHIGSGELNYYRTIRFN